MQMFDMGVSGVGPVRKLSEMTNVMPSADKGTFAAPSMQLFCSMGIHLISNSDLRLLFLISGHVTVDMYSAHPKLC